MSHPIDSIAVLVCTYRRPEMLATLLESLAAQRTERDFDVVAVDNDPAASGREAALAASIRVQYVVEPEPGIAAARNRALSCVGAAHDAAVFVDDDEYVGPGWLESLAHTAEHFDADVVTGPVHGELAPDAPRWLHRGGYFRDHSYPSGKRLTTAKSGNTLIRSPWILEEDPVRFDAAFSRSGGSDTDYFSALHRRGAVLVWSAEAVALEPVPAHRATARWIARRELRGGIVMGKIMMVSSPRAIVLAKGLLRSAVGVLRVVVGTVATLRLRQQDTKVLLFGSGLVGSALGASIDEYGRGPKPS